MYKKCRGQIPVERREPAKKYLLNLLYITTKLYYTVLLEPVCCKKQQKKFLTVTGLWILKFLNGKVHVF